MVFRFKADESVEAGLRRIAQRQIARMIEEIEDPHMPLETTIHQVRKRAKKLRGLIRLVRPNFSDYAAENAAIRDAARMLSGLRDAAVMTQAYDDLLKRYNGEVQRRDFAPVRRRLTLEGGEARKDARGGERLAGFKAAMIKTAERAKDWTPKAEGFEALEGGLKDTYARARRAMAEALKDPNVEAMHEWRKRAKYHWHHARLLHDISPQLMHAHIHMGRRLADLLGEHHDLAVLSQKADTPALAKLTAKRQADIEAEAERLGAQLLEEKPKVLARRWEGYWEAWRKSG